MSLLVSVVYVQKSDNQKGETVKYAGAPAYFAMVVNTWGVGVGYKLVVDVFDKVTNENVKKENNDGVVLCA